MRVKQIINTSTTANGFTYSDPVELSEYPFNDEGVRFYVNHNQSGGIRTATIEGRLHPDAAWIPLNTITATNSQKWYTVTPCPWYRIKITNNGNQLFTIEAHMLR